MKVRRKKCNNRRRLCPCRKDFEQDLPSCSRQYETGRKSVSYIMQNLSQFIENMERKLSANEEQTEAYRRKLYQQHGVRRERMLLFTEEVDQILDTVIQPRMEKLVGFFENATLKSVDATSADIIRCESVFESSPQFPAKVSFGFSISHDAEIKTLCIVCDQEILPVFVKYDAQETLLVKPAAANSSLIETWVETKILSFLDTYFQLARIEQYQRGNLVLDPVCGIQVNKAFVIQEALFENQHYYFCSKDCHDEFTADPMKYRFVKGS